MHNILLLRCTRAMAHGLAWGAAVCTLACAPLRTPLGGGPTSPRLVAEGSFYAGADGDTLFGVPTVINGQTFNFALDHGSNASSISDAAMDSLHRPRQHANATRVVVLKRRHAGEVLAVDSTANEVIRAGDEVTEYWGDFPPVVFDSVRVGRSLQRDFHFPVGLPALVLAPFQGLFGLDVMSQFDLEFDVTARKVRLYERVPPSRIARDRVPPWLPRGMSVRDCVEAILTPSGFKVSVDSALREASKRAIAQGTDTSGGSAEARRDVIATIGEQLWNQEQMLLPVELNGYPVLAEFDSGINETVINWPEAARLGITRSSAGVHPRAESYVRFGEPDTSYMANVTVTIRGDRTLALSTTPLRISDSKFTSPTSGPESVPKVLIGLSQFRDRTLFLSYSTGRVCVSKPNAVTVGSPARDSFPP